MQILVSPILYHHTSGVVGCCDHHSASQEIVTGGSIRLIFCLCYYSKPALCFYIFLYQIALRRSRLQKMISGTIFGQPNHQRGVGGHPIRRLEAQELNGAFCQQSRSQEIFVTCFRTSPSFFFAIDCNYHTKKTADACFVCWVGSTPSVQCGGKAALIKRLRIIMVATMALGQKRQHSKGGVWREQT